MSKRKFERKKWILAENEELKGFLADSRLQYKELEDKYNALLAENTKMKKTLHDIEEVVAPIVTKTVTVSAGKMSFSNIHAGVAE